jgi:hypothetical protein
MNQSPDLRQLLLAYKLGELPAAQRAELDLRLLADAEFSDCLQEAEHDLLADFHAARLSSSDQRRVQHAFTPAQLAQARAFMHAVGVPATDALPRRTMPTLSYRVWGIAAAAMLLVAAGATIVLLHRTTPPPPISQPAPSVGTRSQPPAHSSPAVPFPGRPQPSSSALLLLGATTTRDTGAAHLQLSSTVTVLRVQWVVPDDNAAQSFHLSVTQNGHMLATAPQSGRLGIIGGRRVAEFSLNAASLAAYPSQGDLLFSFFTDATLPALAAQYPVRLKTNLH